MYFTQITLLSILLYNTILLNLLGYKLLLYKVQIYPAFKKIATAMVVKYKIQLRIQKSLLLIYDTIAKMTNNMLYVNALRGRSFTYFTVVARNYILSLLDRGIKYNLRHTSINLTDCDNNYISLSLTSSKLEWLKYKQRLFNKILYSKLFKLILKLILFMILTKDIRSLLDIKIAHAVIRLMEDILYLDNLNRKAVMLYLSLITGLSSNKINKVLSSIKKKYWRVKHYVLNNDLLLLTFYDMGIIK